MAQHYTELQSHLDRVRQAWKRAAALQGLAAVIVEALGMFLLFLLLDYIYVFPQTLRIAALALMGGIVAFLFFRHVIRPYTRVIPDEQVALYIEEREQATEGALLSATTFGKQTGATSAIYGYIVEHIVNSAVEKAGAIQLGRILNVAKLRKYAIAALVVLLFFGVSALRYSSFFGKHAMRMLMPWNMTDEDKKAEGSLIDPGTRMSFELTMNAPKNRLLRGSALKVKAKLSQMPESDVVLSFGTKGSVAFQRLKMDEIDELNGFALRLPDINDDIEVQVETGRPGGVKSVSDRVLVTVYDPLEIKGYEVTLCPPAYTRQKPTTDLGPAGDIAALQGTVVKFRALANAPLAGGTLVFDDGTKVALAGDKGKDNAAGGEFTVSKDGSYTVRVTGSDEQKGDPSSAFSIKALKDEPPSVSVVEPQSDMAAHPAAEVLFKAKAGDDVGIASVEFVYSSSQQEDKTERVKIKLVDDGPGEHDAEAVLALADMQPALHAGDTIFYHFEVRDLKGQPAISDIFMLQLRPYEIAGAYPTLKAGNHPHPPTLDLMLFIAAAWNIHGQKELIPADDYNQRCDDLAARMVNPDGSIIKLKKPKASMVPPEKVPLIAKGDELVKQGVATLRSHDAGIATAQFRKALALWQSLGVAFDMQDKAESLEMGEQNPGGVSDPMKDALGFLKMAPPKEIESPKYDALNLPDYKRAIKPDEAKKLKEEAEDLQRKQQQILEEARRLAALKDDNQKPNDQADNKDPKDNKDTKDAKTADDGKKNPDDQARANPNGEQKPTPAGQGAKPENAHAAAAPGKKDDAAEARGDQTADNDERRQDLQHRQEQLAGEARKLAQDLAKHAPNADKDAKEVIDHFRKSTRAMEEAAAEMKDGNLQRAAARGEEAKKELHAAADKLQLSQYDNLDKAVEAADQRGEKIAGNQKQIREGMKKVLDEAATRNKADPDKGGDPKLNPQDVARLQGLARMQVENQKNAEDLEKYVGDLEKWADDMHKKETGEELRKAARIMKQDNVASTMVTAAVNLGQQETGDAKESQDKLDKTLTKLTVALHSANSSLAGTHEQKLKRALGETKDVIAKAEKLAGIPHDNKDDKNAAGAQNPGKKGDDNKPDADNTGKNGEKQPGEDKKAADAGKNDPEHKDGAKTADANKNDINNPNPGKNGEKVKDLTPEERRQLEAELQHDTQRLAKRLDEDKLADGPIQAQLQTVTSDKSFEEMFKEGQKTQLDKYLGSLHTVSSHLEGKLESVLKSKRLSAAQREQTPAQYRDMVNKYYEQLAKE